MFQNGQTEPKQGFSLLSHWSTIRTRLKASIFGAFAFVILKRRQPYFVLRTQNRSKIRGFEVEEF
jgi:hypothetical protein